MKTILVLFILCCAVVLPAVGELTALQISRKLTQRSERPKIG